MKMEHTRGFLEHALDCVEDYTKEHTRLDCPKAIKSALNEVRECLHLIEESFKDLHEIEMYLDEDYKPSHDHEHDDSHTTSGVTPPRRM